MKKIIVSIVAFVSFFVFSCSKSEVNVGTPIPEGWHKVSIKADTFIPEYDVETKTAYASDMYFSWTTGDKISVLMNNGVENKFFTLTAVSGGSATADFTGAVEEGYDYFGSVADGTKWALYPASDNHEYHEDWTEADAYKILFDIPREIDLSTNLSANIPMKAIGDGSNNYSFKPISATFKFTFKLAAGISKVKLHISRPEGYSLSGMMPFRNTDGEYLAFEKRQSRGTVYGDVSITTSVETVGSDHLATFYVPYRIWQKLKTPTITLTNMDNDCVIFTGTMTDGITANDQKRLTIVPTADVTAKGLGNEYIIALGIDWGAVDMYPADDSKDAFPSSGSKITEWKFTSDATNVYFFYKIPADMDRAYKSGYIVASFDTDNDAATGNTSEKEKYGHGVGFEYYNYVYPFSNDSVGTPTFNSGRSGDNYSWTGDAWSGGSSSKSASTYGVLRGGNIYVETSLPRTTIGSPTSGATIRVNTSVNSYPAGAQIVTLK